MKLLPMNITLHLIENHFPNNQK